jgi:hypothetical protein
MVLIYTSSLVASAYTVGQGPRKSPRAHCSGRKLGSARILVPYAVSWHPDRFLGTVKWHPILFLGTPAYYIRLSTWEPELIIIMSELVWIAYTRPQNGVDSDGLPGISSGFLGWNSLQTNQPINYPAGSQEQSLFGGSSGRGRWRLVKYAFRCAWSM